MSGEITRRQMLKLLGIAGGLALLPGGLRPEGFADAQNEQRTLQSPTIGLYSDWLTEIPVGEMRHEEADITVGAAFQRRVDEMFLGLSGTAPENLKNILKNTGGPFIEGYGGDQLRNLDLLNSLSSFDKAAHPEMSDDPRIPNNALLHTTMLVDADPRFNDGTLAHLVARYDVNTADFPGMTILESSHTLELPNLNNGEGYVNSWTTYYIQPKPDEQFFVVGAMLFREGYTYTDEDVLWRIEDFTQSENGLHSPRIQTGPNVEFNAIATQFTTGEIVDNPIAFYFPNGDRNNVWFKTPEESGKDGYVEDGWISYDPLETILGIS